MLLASAAESNEVNCQLCEFVMSTVKEQLDDPATEADILDQAAQVQQISPCSLNHPLQS